MFLLMITREELKALTVNLKEENIYNFRNFKKQLDEIFNEEYMNIYVGLFDYIFKELGMHSDAEMLKATDEQLDKIVAYINEFKDKRNMDFVYESRM